MQDHQDRGILSVTTTVGSAAEAEALAVALMDARLAACVQVEPGVVSHYRWEGRRHADPEVRLTIKTLPAAEAALQAFFAAHHPYDVPQFLATPMRASPAYADWVRGEVSLPAAP